MDLFPNGATSELKLNLFWGFASNINKETRLVFDAMSDFEYIICLLILIDLCKGHVFTNSVFNY